MTHLIDETGNRYSKLLVIGRAANKETAAAWNYKCDCGSTGVVKGKDLRNGNKKSCGCSNTRNLIGNKYGKLVVISPIKRNGPIRGGIRGGTWWICRCDCGNIIPLRGRALITRKHRSCGCWILSPKEAAFRRLFYDYKLSAKNRRLEFSIPESEFRKLIKSVCFYCGVSPGGSYKVERHRNKLTVFRYNGLDRKNNKLGYILTNVVPCCRICNYAKRTLTYGKFNAWIDRLIKTKLNKRTV